MKLMTHSCLFILVCSIISCAGGKDTGDKFEEETPFTLTQVYFQKWVAGVQGGGSGINVYFNVEEVTDDIEIESIYFRKRKEKASSNSGQPDAYVAYFKSAMNRDVVMSDDATKEALNTPPESFPFELDENDAVLSYTQNGSLHYFKIQAMEERPLLAYPSANPNEKF